MTQKRNTKSLMREIGEVVLALVIAWLGYQLLSAVTGTSLPIVAVVSESMYHTSEFDQWWNEKGKFYESNGIAEQSFKDFPFRSGLSRGDLLFVMKTDPTVGNVVIYKRSGQIYTIVHRIVKITDSSITTKGDNNMGPDPQITKGEVEGTVLVAVPLLGYPRFILFAFGI